VQAASPSSAKVCAGQAWQAVSLVGAQAAETTEPAAQAEQLAHGDWPLALHVAPAAQPVTGAQTRPAASQKKPEAHEQLPWPSSAPAL